MGVSLRQVDRSDLELLLAWAHIKEIWTYLPTSRRDENLTWEDHLAWWKSREQREDWMIEVESDDFGLRAVGVITVNLKSLEVGIYIGEITLWEKGVGQKAMRKIIANLLERGNEVLTAVIHPENRRSIRLFTSLGFSEVGPARRGQNEYRLDLRTTVKPESAIRRFKIGDRLSSPASSL